MKLLGEFDYSDYSFLAESIQRYEGAESKVEICLKGNKLTLDQAIELRDKIENLYLRDYQKNHGMSREEAEHEFFLHVTRAMLSRDMTFVQVSKN